MPHTPEHTSRTHYVGLFEDRTDAEKAADALRAKGFKDDEIGYAWKDDSGTHNTGEAAVKGAATGAVAGGLLGAAAAGLIPGIGPILAGGILAGIVTGAAAGAAVGGIAGALSEMGVPDEEAKYYEDEFKQGRTLMTVKSGDRYDEAGDIIRRGRGYDYETRRERPSSADVDAGKAR
jgi:hypothetical protein